MLRSSALIRGFDNQPGTFITSLHHCKGGGLKRVDWDNVEKECFKIQKAKVLKKVCPIVMLAYYHLLSSETLRILETMEMEMIHPWAMLHNSKSTV
ncbi:tripartite motif-containing protein 44 isoform X1 [Tachysurus ichikawai]